MEQPLAAGLSLGLQCSETFSFAEQLSGVRLIQGLQLTNTSPQAVDGLTIVFDIAALKIRTEPIPLQTVHGGETLDLSDHPFTPDLASTQELTENEKAVLICTLLKRRRNCQCQRSRI